SATGETYFWQPNRFVCLQNRSEIMRHLPLLVNNFFAANSLLWRICFFVSTRKEYSSSNSGWLDLTLCEEVVQATNLMHFAQNFHGINVCLYIGGAPEIIVDGIFCILGL
ncbi:hypothetical protein AAKU67_003515, partial [Oxalobacteraceae bacterium GrIS 2.11]